MYLIASRANLPCFCLRTTNRVSYGVPFPYSHPHLLSQGTPPVAFPESFPSHWAETIWSASGLLAFASYVLALSTATFAASLAAFLTLEQPRVAFPLSMLPHEEILPPPRPRADLKTCSQSS